MYSFGSFDVLKKNFKHFIIFSPLLGKEYEILLDDINYEEFAQALECCIPQSRKWKIDPDIVLSLLK